MLWSRKLQITTITMQTNSRSQILICLAGTREGPALKTSWIQTIQTNMQLDHIPTRDNNLNLLIYLSTFLPAVGPKLQLGSLPVFLLKATVLLLASPSLNLMPSFFLKTSFGIWWTDRATCHHKVRNDFVDFQWSSCRNFSVIILA